MAAREQVTRGVGTVLAVSICVAAALASAGPAQASAASYIGKLTNAGISVPGGDVELLEWGYEACKLLEMGNDYDAARAHAIYNSGSRPVYNLTVAQANTIMDTAISDLCDDRT